MLSTKFADHIKYSNVLLAYLIPLIRRCKIGKYQISEETYSGSSQKYRTQQVDSLKG